MCPIGTAVPALESWIGLDHKLLHTNGAASMGCALNPVIGTVTEAPQGESTFVFLTQDKTD